MMLSSRKHWSMVRRRTKVILTPLTRQFWAQSASRDRLLSGSFMPCFSALATESLPKYWNVQEKKLMPLSNALWIDTRGSLILNKLPYQQMRSEAGFEVWTVELLGYLATRLDNENTYVCLATCKMVKPL